MPSTLISLRTLSDPTRARLMHILQAQELSVAEIQEILGMGQSRISTHLAQLKRAGLVQDRRAGKNIYYSWNPTGTIKEPEIQEILGMGQSRISTHLAQLKRAGLVQDRRAGKNIYYSWNPTGPIKEPELSSLVRLAVADMPEAALDRSSLHHVMAKRKNRARDYFNKLAGKFGRSYCPGRSWQSLAHLFLTMIPPIDVADLGAGEGTLSQVLAKSARKVIA